MEQYTEQLSLRNIRSQTTGSSFLAGCDDITARTESVRTALHIRPEGTPKLRVLRDSVPDLEREMKRYKKKVNYIGGASIVTDTPNTRGEVHLCQCLEYLCAYDPKYHRPAPNPEPDAWWIKWMKDRAKQRGLGESYIYLGPQGASDVHDA